jgi:hypothetical protein
MSGLDQSTSECLPDGWFLGSMYIFSHWLGWVIIHLRIPRSIATELRDRSKWASAMIDRIPNLQWIPCWNSGLTMNNDFLGWKNFNSLNSQLFLVLRLSSSAVTRKYLCTRSPIKKQYKNYFLQNYFIIKNTKNKYDDDSYETHTQTHTYRFILVCNGLF